MPRLIDPPPELTVALHPQRAPGRITGEALRGDAVPINRWLVDQDWWDQPVRREYWKVLISETLLAEIYQDLATDRWYLERLYD